MCRKKRTNFLSFFGCRKGMGVEGWGVGSVGGFVGFGASLKGCLVGAGVVLGKVN